jgi:electron transfer flavoprotein alpha subunit
MTILVIAEHDNRGLKSATLNTVKAAANLPGDIHLLVAGANCADVAKAAATIQGVAKVWLAEHAAYENFLPENLAALVADIAGDYDYILTPSSTSGKNLLPRLGALLDVQPLSDVIAIEGPDLFKRPIYAGNVIATIRSHDRIKLMTIRATAFDAASATGGAADTETIEAVHDLEISRFIGEELAKLDRPELTSARIVISGGRGLQNGDNFQLLYSLADKMGAAVGASRAAVDAGFVPNDMQVGQTGKIVAPDLYIAVGLSGAIQHLAGMKDSKVIVAINKDEDAPIFQVADYGLVADLFQVIPELEKAL